MCRPEWLANACLQPEPERTSAAIRTDVKLLCNKYVVLFWSRLVYIESVMLV